VSHLKSRPLDEEALGRIFARYPGIEAVYLFGSWATGTVRENSDLDLGIVPGGSEVRDRRLELLTDLAREGFVDVDLVFLDIKDIVLRYEAVRLNRLIYQTPGFDRGAYYSYTVRLYLDFLPYLQVQREALKARILQKEYPYGPR
jgi:uncharacterized protein